ncbi:MAG TPA: BlaI/MecI/CopY family transcriptional regulator [Saprospiraceae bacterium]|nr:BlaI/MecI/CopY family transcriptional regulator [Saprospiraceae bacterium]
MSKNKSVQPTESELEILQVLWAEGPSPVRAVNDRLNEQREVGYTTTLKMMQLMLKKGLVARDASSRTHIYRAAVTEAQTRAQLLDRFVDTAFRGSAMELVMQALGNEDTSEDELKEIKDFIQQIESERKKGK